MVISEKTAEPSIKGYIINYHNFLNNEIKNEINRIKTYKFDNIYGDNNGIEDNVIDTSNARCDEQTNKSFCNILPHCNYNDSKEMCQIYEHTTLKTKLQFEPCNNRTFLNRPNL